MPRVKTVIGRERRTKIGLTRVFKMPKMTAAKRAVKIESITKPLKKPAKAKNMIVFKRILCHHFTKNHSSHLHLLLPHLQLVFVPYFYSLFY